MILVLHSNSYRSVWHEGPESTEGQASHTWAGPHQFAVLSRLIPPSPAFLLTENPSPFRCILFGDGKSVTIQMHKFRARDFQEPSRWAQKQR